jgi:hypothetical protein
MTDREIRKQAARHGLEVLSVEKAKRRGHTHVRLRRACDGEDALFVFAGSPSDGRGALNNDARLSRFASGAWSPKLDRG